jgi:hypothetical protein
VLIGELGRRGAPAAQRAPGGFEVLGGDGERRLLSPEQYAALMGSLSYSLALPAAKHPGYERVHLEEVSRELLHIVDVEDCRADADGILAAVAFRRLRTS